MDNHQTKTTSEEKDNVCQAEEVMKWVENVIETCMDNDQPKTASEEKDNVC